MFNSPFESIFGEIYLKNIFFYSIHTQQNKQISKKYNANGKSICNRAFFIYP